MENERYKICEQSRCYLWKELSEEIKKMLETHKAQSIKDQNREEVIVGDFICKTVYLRLDLLKNEEKTKITKIKEACPENIKLIQSLSG